MIILEKSHYAYIIGMVIIGIFSSYVLIFRPHGLPVPALESSFYLFGLAMNTLILLYSISGFLLYRWLKTGRNNPSLLIWALSFLLYSLTFVAHLFRAFGVVDANENTSPLHFFAYRWVMIVWAAGILFGLLKIVTDNKKTQLIPSGIVIVGGFSILLLGLFIIPFDNPIESTMYIFLYTIWVPICFTMSYIFAYLGSKGNQRGPKYISLGFLLLMISYMAWAPWHFSDVIYLYFIWYFIFNLSLTPILIGFIVMSVEI